MIGVSPTIEMCADALLTDAMAASPKTERNEILVLGGSWAEENEHTWHLGRFSPYGRGARAPPWPVDLRTHTRTVAAS